MRHASSAYEIRAGGACRRPYTQIRSCLPPLIRLPLRAATFPWGKAFLCPGGRLRRFLPLKCWKLAGEACLAPTVPRRGICRNSAAYTPSVPFGDTSPCTPGGSVSPVRRIEVGASGRVCALQTKSGVRDVLHPFVLLAHPLLHGILHDSKGKFSSRFDSSYQFIPAGQKFLAILRCAGIMGPVVY